MFDNYVALVDIDISDFKMNLLKDMKYMFHVCTQLKSININHSNTQNVDNIDGLIKEYKKLTELDLSNFILEKNKDMPFMFLNCEKLTKIDLGKNKYKTCGRV